MPRSRAAVAAFLALLVTTVAAACGEDNPEIGSSGGTELSCADPSEVQVPHGHDDGKASPEAALGGFLESTFADGLPETGYTVDHRTDTRAEYLYEREGKPLIQVHLNEEDGWVVEGFSACGEFSRP